MKSLSTISVRLLFAVVIPILVFTSCKKDEETWDSYMSERFEIRPIRLYSKDGEIHDQSLIISFINRHTIGHNIRAFITNYDTIIDVEDQIKVEYLSPKTATFTYLEEITQRNVIEKADHLIFEAFDTTTIHHFNTNEFLPDFFENLSVYRPLYSEFHELPLSTGFRGFTKLKRCYFLERKTNNELSFPSFFCLLVRYFEPGIQEQNAIFGMNNDFNAGSIQYLNEGDTIALQQSAIILRK
jgi:hypothetical protein